MVSLFYFTILVHSEIEQFLYVLMVSFLLFLPTILFPSETEQFLYV